MYVPKCLVRCPGIVTQSAFSQFCVHFSADESIYGKKFSTQLLLTVVSPCSKDCLLVCLFVCFDCPLQSKLLAVQTGNCKVKLLGIVTAPSGNINHIEQNLFSLLKSQPKTAFNQFTLLRHFQWGVELRQSKRSSIR